MERFTEKVNDYWITNDKAHIYYLDTNESVFVGNAIDRLAELEDVLERWHIENPTILDFYLQTIKNINMQNANMRNELADLQHKLKVSEIATKLACERVKCFEEMQDREMGFEDFFGYESNYDLQGIMDNYIEQAEKELKGEQV